MIRLALRLAARGFDLFAWLTHPRVIGASVIVWRGDEFLVVEQSYRDWLATPGGRVQRGEEPREAARRELSEEVGLEAAAADLVALDSFTLEHSNLRDTVHFFAWRLPRGAAVRIDEREIVAARFVLPQDAPREDLWPPLRNLLERGVTPL